MRRILTLAALLALSGCAPHPTPPAGPHVAVTVAGLGLGGRMGTVANTGGVALAHVTVFVEVDLPGAGPSRGMFSSYPPGWTKDLSPGQSEPFAVELPPALIRTAYVEADGEDGHPVPIPFTLEKPAH